MSEVVCSIKRKPYSDRTSFLNYISVMVFLWPMPIFRNQGSRWPIYDADFFGPIFFIFSPSSQKRVRVNVYCRAQDSNSSSSLIHSNNTWLKT